MFRRRSVEAIADGGRRAASPEHLFLAAFLLVIALMFSAAMISPADAQQSGCDTQYSPGVEPCPEPQPEPQPEPSPTAPLQALLDDPSFPDLPAGTETTLVNALDQVDVIFVEINATLPDVGFSN